MQGSQPREPHRGGHGHLEHTTPSTPSATPHHTPRSDAEIRRGVRGHIDQHFHPERREQVHDFVQRFSPRGQVEVANLLGYAEIFGKVGEALIVLEEFYPKYWGAQRRDQRGDPEAFPKNKEYLASVRNRLGIPEPQK